MSDPDNTQDSAAMPPASAGSVSEPVAWEVFLPGVGTYDIHSFRWEAAAIAHALLSNEGTIAAVCPLFRQPQPALTDEEREAVWAAWCDYANAARMQHKPTRQEIAAGLRALLERTK